jgi:hypothetical protein
VGLDLRWDTVYRDFHIHLEPRVSRSEAAVHFAAAFISASTAALARDEVPFNGTVSGYVEIQKPVDRCTVHIHVVNFGNANHLGAFTGTAEFYPNFCEDPANITYTGNL